MIITIITFDKRFMGSARIEETVTWSSVFRGGRIGGGLGPHSFQTASFESGRFHRDRNSAAIDRVRRDFYGKCLRGYGDLRLRYRLLVGVDRTAAGHRPHLRRPVRTFRFVFRQIAANVHTGAGFFDPETENIVYTGYS